MQQAQPDDDEPGDHRGDLEDDVVVGALLPAGGERARNKSTHKHCRSAADALDNELTTAHIVVGNNSNQRGLAPLEQLRIRS